VERKWYLTLLGLLPLSPPSLIRHHTHFLYLLQLYLVARWPPFKSKPFLSLALSEFPYKQDLSSTASLTVPFTFAPVCMRPALPGMVCLAFCQLLVVSCLAYSLTLKIEAICFSETSDYAVLQPRKTRCLGDLQWHRINTMFHENQSATSKVEREDTQAACQSHEPKFFP
jgi:hypothetical protein